MKQVNPINTQFSKNEENKKMLRKKSEQAYKNRPENVYP